jgi:hypothetical protein
MLSTDENSTLDTQTTINVEAKVLGKSKSLFSGWQPKVNLPTGADGQTTLRDLITAVVTSEVAAFHERQDWRKLARVLTAEQIQQGAEAGKVDSGGGQVEPQTVDLQDAIATALHSFEDGLYYTFVDTRPIIELDQRVAVHEGSHLLFVRLVALVGG